MNSKLRHFTPIHRCSSLVGHFVWRNVYTPVAGGVVPRAVFRRISARASTAGAMNNYSWPSRPAISIHWTSTMLAVMILYRKGPLGPVTEQFLEQKKVCKFVLSMREEKYHTLFSSNENFLFYGAPLFMDLSGGPIS